MPTQLPSEPPVPGVARRSLLRGAAGLGAVGLAAAAGAGAVAAATRQPASAAAAAPAPRTAAGTAARTAARASGADPLVVYVRDAAAGEFEVFHGTRQVRVRNPRLVAQLLDGIATAQ
jgi:hypothetical protein